MLIRLSQALAASDDVSPNGAALIGFYGRNARKDGRRTDDFHQTTDRRIRHTLPEHV